MKWTGSIDNSPVTIGSIICDASSMHINTFLSFGSVVIDDIVVAITSYAGTYSYD